MGEWSAFKKCCYCISLTIGSKAIGSFFLLLTLGRTWNIAIVSINGDSPPGLFIAYLMKIEDVRDFILDDMYGISPCTIAPLETLIDSCFEFSILVNLLVVSGMTARAFRNLSPVPGLCSQEMDPVVAGALAGDVLHQHHRPHHSRHPHVPLSTEDWSWSSSQ